MENQRSTDHGARVLNHTVLTGFIYCILDFEDNTAVVCFVLFSCSDLTQLLYMGNATERNDNNT